MKKSSSNSSSSERETSGSLKILDQKYSIIRNLGGTVNTKAHLVKDIITSDILAIKIAQKEEKDELEREYDFLTSFDHPNIIKPFIYVSEGALVSEDENKLLSYKTEDEEYFDSKECAYFTLKFYENGDLFENISRGGPVHEGMARYYFLQLVNAVEYLHLRNVAHRDIKLDNILLDDNFQAMLIDFGFSEECRLKVGDKLDDCERANIRGTKGYISPEQLYADGNDLICFKKCDIFALGVVLFILLKGVRPFESPTRDDEKYQYLILKKNSYFWKMHQMKRREFSNKVYSILSHEVKSLVCDLLNPDPNKRPDISEIKEHPWFAKKEVLSDEEIKKLMSDRILN
ncbi:unnamed protein product [Moneuplotes crassus]|uniref:non-specific serine/threonine protein kinase n=1 Tax=Euplotes crassus TaxID=5936 RepID=A0AAD2CXE6_EUPCR|nr:unnamed protein product [Moneuplotes crassus]